MASLKNYILVLFLFQFTLHAQVTATINQLKVDNIPITTNTIAFNSNPTINISLNVHLETSNGSTDNTFGNLTIYYKKNENDYPTQVGFHSVTFYLKTYYTNDTPFNTIILNKNIFFNTGGILYAEYKNNKNQTYQSGKIPITNGSLTIPTVPTIPPTPSQVSPISIVTKDIKYSNDFPILNNKIPTTNNNSIYLDVDTYLKNSNTESSNIKVYLRKESIGSVTTGDHDGNMIILKSVSINSAYDNYLQLKDVEINPINLDYTNYTYILKTSIERYSSNGSINGYGDNYIRKDNKIINIILAKPIINNVISENQSILINSFSKPLTGTIAKTGFDSRNTIDIKQYQWQQKYEGSNWTNINGATLQNYSPTNNFTQNTSFRRIAINEDGFQNPSEYITISTTTPPTNNICCDQNLPYNSSQPTTFTGNTPNNSISYQWQISQKSAPWINITDANNSSCNFIFQVEASRGYESASFRRLIIENESIISASNSITITRSTAADPTIVLPPPTRQDVPGRRLSTIQNNTFDINNLAIYPNPVINNLYIEGSININLINLYDSFGQKINIEKHQKSENLIEINTSNLQPGIFILKIDNTTFSKTLIKN